MQLKGKRYNYDGITLENLDVRGWFIRTTKNKPRYDINIELGDGTFIEIFLSSAQLVEMLDNISREEEKEGNQ